MTREYVCMSCCLKCQETTLLWTADREVVFEPLYQFLGDKSKGLIEIHESLEKLPALNDLKTSEQTLIIFDDFITDIKKR